MLDDQDRVLLVRRADDGRWTLVTGCLDPGEQPAVGIVREILEETAVVASRNGWCAWRATHRTCSRTATRPSSSHLVFRCRAVSGTARVNDEESTDVGWYPVDALPRLPDRHLTYIRRALEDTKETWFAT